MDSRNDKFDIYIDRDDVDKDVDETKYVVAKNGITVTVEGNDKEKIDKLIREIKKNLDIKNQ